MPGKTKIKTPAELKKIADAVVARKQAAEQAVRAKAAHEHKQAVAAKVEECHAAMGEAAADGRHSCEVDIEDELFGDVATALTDYSPKSHGDGYGRNVIYLSWR
jgi:hypothetical protein